MAMSSACGVCWLMTAGCLLTGALSIVKLLTKTGWPELTIQAGGYMVSCFGVAMRLAIEGKGRPPKGEGRWAWSAGLFMSMSMVICILSVKLGTPIGDLSSLVSINVVLSALLGRLLLGDPLRWCHAVSAFCAFSGALLISRPSILFGRPEVGATHTPDTAWLGYFLGPIAGFFDACTIISLRKCSSTSEWQIALVYYSQAAILLMLLMLVPGLEAHPLAKLEAAPAQAAMWIAAITAFDLPSMVIYGMAAKALPAALSATVDTASRMVLGFVADFLLFGEELHFLTCTGAGLMLLAVAVNAMVREQPLEAHLESNPPSTAQHESQDMEDDIASVASFAASEFVDVEPSARRNLGRIAQQLRLRFQQSKLGNAALGPVQTLGAASA